MELTEAQNIGLEWLFSEAQHSTKDNSKPVTQYMLAAFEMQQRGAMSAQNIENYHQFLERLATCPDNTPVQVIRRGKRGRPRLDKNGIRRERILAIFSYCFNQMDHKKYPLSEAPAEEQTTTAFTKAADRFNEIYESKKGLAKPEQAQKAYEKRNKEIQKAYEYYFLK